MKSIYFLFSVIFISTTTFSQTKKLLIIGLDGCRADVINKKYAPTLDSIIYLRNTAYSYRMKNEKYTMSAPNWSSMLTGVHCNKHKAKTNNAFFKGDFTKYPHFFKYLKDEFPNIKTASYPTWMDINKYIVNGFSDFAPVEKNDLEDTIVENKTLEWLNVSNDSIYDAIFIHLEDIDHNGHLTKFSPKNINYTNAVSRKDAFIKNVFEAIELRKEKYKEDWLVIISTDHGGRRTSTNNGHSVGLLNLKIRRVPLIMNGNKVIQGKLKNPHTIDIAYSCLHFFNVEIKKEWKLQGKSVGLK